MNANDPHNDAEDVETLLHRTPTHPRYGMGGRTRPIRLPRRIQRPGPPRFATNLAHQHHGDHRDAPILVPCHRVLRSDGAIGQYRCGAAAKEQLLTLERAA